MKKLLDKFFPAGVRDVARFLKNTLLVILGTAILAIGTGLFLIPNNLVSGGVSGIGIILHNEIGILPADVYASILVWALFIVGIILLGKTFALQTLVSSLTYPFFLSLGTALAETEFFNITSSAYDGYGGIGIILATVFGGAMVGAGCALTFVGGGSTGGSDVIALVICKFFKKLNTSIVIFIIDASIVILGAFALGDLVLTMLGIIAALVCAVSLDKIFLGESSAFIAQVISDKTDEISSTIIRQMNRTTTISNVVGGYTGQERKMIMVTFSVRQYAIFSAIVSSIDKNAFITLHRAHEISGDGWTYNIEYNPTELNPDLEEKKESE